MRAIVLKTKRMSEWFSLLINENCRPISVIDRAKARALLPRLALGYVFEPLLGHVSLSAFFCVIYLW
jgi:hypothetical protein